MPRKAFKEDLTSAQNVPFFGRIAQVEAGEDDGFSFHYHYADLGVSVQITALVSDLSDYPTKHEYMLFAEEDAPPPVAEALATVSNFYGKPITAFLLALSKYLGEETATGTRNDPLEVDSDGDIELPDSQFEDAEDSDLYEENEDWDTDGEDSFHQQNRSPSRPLGSLGVATRGAHLARARSDLKKAKTAGFKIGHVGHMSTGSSCFISVAIRCHKLGISEEAMQAWNLAPGNYLMLILYYASGYQPLDVLLEQTSGSAVQELLQMVVAVSDTYKPRSFAAAQRLFQIQNHRCEGDGNNEESGDDLRESFISRPLNALLKDRMLEIIRVRLNQGFGWSQAEKWFHDNQGHSNHASDNEISMDDPSPYDPSLHVTTADEMISCQTRKELSLPLVAMQFMLRHFVKCTEFCLNCHCQLETRFQDAIKPYVCEKPLCLYQFMSLGFGPSIEHDIIHQGYTVDLLLSFAYSSAAAFKLQSFPEGLGMMVPDVDLPIRGWTRPIKTAPPYRHMPPTSPAKVLSTSRGNRTTLQQASVLHKARFDHANHSLIFDSHTYSSCPFHVGDYIIVTPLNYTSQPAGHYRVQSTCFFPSVQLSLEPLTCSDTIVDTTVASDHGDTEAFRPSLIQVVLQVYDQNFDNLNDESRCKAIVLLLDLMPKISDMRVFLKAHPGIALTSWQNRMSSAQVSLLRWIIASNRSCILQVDQMEDYTGKVVEERVQGFPNHLQFRFAMGSPDKEARFSAAVASVNPNHPHPSLFAWHGSDFANWHSIIRGGLNYETMSNGRAYGNGVYFARDFNTSVGYCRSAAKKWPQSELAVDGAVALNEIINAPAKFVSSTPYYVVQDIDWIQTRYLFVRTTKSPKILRDPELVVQLAQDPARVPTGTDGRPIALPITAVPKSRRKVSVGSQRKLGTNASTAMSLKIRNDGLSDVNISLQDDDAASIVTDIEDIEMLLEEEAVNGNQQTSQTGPPELRATKVIEPILVFVLGAHKNSKFPLLSPPPYATPIATRRLQKDFRLLSQMQSDHQNAKALHDLGWWLDQEHVTNTNNLYQWIVELHSFPMTLPLAIDMDKRNIRSIVFEIRFHASYPMSPPFIRIVRPRFKTFAQGGGGHVTAGGSICMDLLTSSGWSAANSIESVLMQIRMAIMSQDPRPARLETLNNHPKANDEYKVAEAIEAFKRACRAHGWVIPEGLSEIAFS